MAIKHQIIEPFRVAVATYAEKTYTAGGTIVKGAPCVFSAGLAVEATDVDAGAAGPLIGFSLHAATVGQPILIAPAYPGRVFVGSLTSLATAIGSDAGAKALAVSDQGTVVELHKDDTTLKWVLGATGGANVLAVVLKLIDKVGATTNDDPEFGQEGTAGPNSGKALVEFTVQVSDTIFG